MRRRGDAGAVSVLFNEPKLLKFLKTVLRRIGQHVSVLFNEPKLLKLHAVPARPPRLAQFQCSSTSRNC